MEQEQLQEIQIQRVALYILCTISISFWIIIWIMHLCALTNAKIKFSKKSYLFAANKRKTKVNIYQYYKQQFMKNNHQLLICADEQQDQAVAANEQQLPHPTSYHHPETDEGQQEATKDQLLSPNGALNISRPPEQKRLDARCPHDTCYCFTTCLHVNQDSGQKASKEYCKSSADNTHSSFIDLNKYKYNHFKSCYIYISLPLPGVSIIKPLEPDDPATVIVGQLLKKYPGVDARLFIGGSRVGVNPKINNMQPAYESMKYELVLISDSGIQMRRDTLIDMVSHMDQDVALVHQMPFVNFHERNSFQSIVERVYFGTVHARAYLTADLLNINCPTGMSALMRKCLLDEVGGIKAFGQYLAEDFFFAKSFTERGWKICISSQPALQNSANSSDTLSTLNSRIQRWIKLRFAMVPQWTLIEPFSECMLLGLLGAISINSMWCINPAPVFVLHVLVWFLLDYNLICTIQNESLTCSKSKFLAAWLIRECTALLIFMKALSDPKVTWRSREFKLKWGGYTEEVLHSPQDEKADHDCVPVLTKKSTDFVQNQKLPTIATCEA